ncbi:hypothetical protein DPMN_031964 [Dreissena polymorpha]|uniref:Uncharacterized protein n=1 Tax=Dreissena polymorpha TaxID=45954 RepID=A0A9D4M2V1_DREPO|nr:hypothetical protein DPMN_031964 [Dreissena polymorpha]
MINGRGVVERGYNMGVRGYNGGRGYNVVRGGYNVGARGLGGGSGRGVRGGYNVVRGGYNVAGGYNAGCIVIASLSFAIQLVTKFGEDRIKFWARQTDRQTDSYIALYN